MKKTFLFLIVAGLCAGLPAAAETPLQLEFLRVTPEIDGDIDADAVWQPLAWHSLRKLHADAAPERAARFKMAYGATAFYLAIDCAEPAMERIRANAGDLGDVWFDDCVEIFFANAGGGYDQLLFNSAGKRNNLRHDPARQEPPALWEWQVAVRRHPDGWTAEVVIPYLELNLGDGFIGDLRFNLAREAHADGLELSTFAPLEGNFHDIANYARLELIHSAGAESIFARYEADRAARGNLAALEQLRELRRRAATGDAFAAGFLAEYAAEFARLDELAQRTVHTEEERRELAGIGRLLDEAAQGRNERVAREILEELFAE